MAGQESGPKLSLISRRAHSWMNCEAMIVEATGIGYPFFLHSLRSRESCYLSAFVPVTNQATRPAQEDAHRLHDGEIRLQRPADKILQLIGSFCRLKFAAFEPSAWT